MDVIDISVELPLGRQSGRSAMSATSLKLPKCGQVSSAAFAVLRSASLTPCSSTTIRARIVQTNPAKLYFKQFDTLHHQCFVDEMLQIRVLELRAGERLKLKLWSCSSDVVWRRRSEPLRTV
ncbi:MAG: hypothetical protein ABS39_11275 [Acidovorax sp. SCN 65-28]|nr:MAG: hypothetical protein ABS39_11275 [Acidovorax sp. SCN 65-28]